MVMVQEEDGSLHSNIVFTATNFALNYNYITWVVPGQALDD